MKESIDNRLGRQALTIPYLQDGSATATLSGRVDSYFRRYGLPSNRSRILVAVSGGPDSVALFSVLAHLSDKTGWGLGVVHVDHGLRGKESEGDCEFVRQLALDMHTTFYSKRLNPDARRAKQNIQAWARSERYKFLEHIAGRCGYSHIAVAHHLDDRAETVAAAVIDAGGTFALSGIPPVRGNIIRPLFDATRSEIMSYLSVNGIAHRTDSSNESTKYQRNRIRQSVLPQWKVENPAIVEGLARLGEQLWMQRCFLEKWAARIVKQSSIPQSGQDGLMFGMASLFRHDPAMDPFIIRELVSLIGLDIIPGPALVSRFSDLRNGRSQTGMYSIEQGQFALSISQGYIKVYKKRMRIRVADSRLNDSVAPKLTTRIVSAKVSQRADDKMLARFDLDAVEGELSVRWPKPGDRYQPIGMQGTKKLSDLLADRKVPSFERPLVPVVVDKRGILWPVGHPIAHRVRLTDRTRRVMEARLQEGSWKNRS